MILNNKSWNSGQNSCTHKLMKSISWLLKMDSYLHVEVGCQWQLFLVKTFIVGLVMKHGHMLNNTTRLNSVPRYVKIGDYRLIQASRGTRFGICIQCNCNHICIFNVYPCYIRINVILIHKTRFTILSYINRIHACVTWILYELFVLILLNIDIYTYNMYITWSEWFIFIH